MAKDQKTASSSKSKPKSSAIKQAEAKAEKIVAQKEKEKSKGNKKNVKKQNRVAQYFRELKSELKKVVWPSKKTVLNNTGVVLAVVCMSSIVVWGIDSIFVKILSLITGQAG